MMNPKHQKQKVKSVKSVNLVGARKKGGTQLYTKEGKHSPHGKFIYVKKGKGHTEMVENKHYKEPMPPIVIKKGQAYSFERPQAFSGLGKYNTKPEAAIHEAPRQREKKREYKKRLKEAQSGNWWDSLCKQIPAAISTVAPMMMKGLAGFGDYEVDTNSILSGATKGDNGSELPMMMNTKVANVIRHREFIANVIGSTTEFSLTSYPINPGLDETFPWLYLIANCFTSYRIRGMVIEFKSLASDYTTSTYLGFVCMGTQYNSLEQVFPDKETMENSEYANSTKPSKDLLHPIECSPQQQVLTQLYIRAGTIPLNADLKMYDLGRFSIATGGQTANGIIGELWATYEVELLQPKLSRNFGSTINVDHWQTQTDSGDSTHPFGTDAVQAVGVTMLGKIIPSTAIYLFPAGETSGIYRIWYRISSGTLTTLVPPTFTYTNCVLKSIIRGFGGYVGSAGAPQSGIVGTLNYAYIAIVQLTGGNATITLGVGGTLPPGGVDFMVSQIPSSMSLEYQNEEWKQKKLRGYKDHAYDKVDIVRKFERIKRDLKIEEEDSSSSSSDICVEDSDGGCDIKITPFMKKIQDGMIIVLMQKFKRVMLEVITEVVRMGKTFAETEYMLELYNESLFSVVQTFRDKEHQMSVMNMEWAKEERGIVYLFDSKEASKENDYSAAFWAYVPPAKQQSLNQPDYPSVSYLQEQYSQENRNILKDYVPTYSGTNSK